MLFVNKRFLCLLFVVALAWLLLFNFHNVFHSKKLTEADPLNNELSVLQTLEKRVSYLESNVGRSGIETNDFLILYNRIPKTGSTSFMNVTYTLTTVNKFSAMFVNVSSANHRFTFIDQYKFATNITNWVQRKPAIYHGHFPFLNFNAFGVKQPLYINIVREPLERLVSHYYFVRYGDTFLPNKKRKYQGDRRTFDECVKQKSSSCSFQKLWLQIPYFCGSEPECWVPGSDYAFERAKFNVVTYYFLVGVTEKLELFIALLDEMIPSMFRGAKKLFLKDGGVHIRKTKVKKPLEQVTIDYFKNTKVWRLEQEFYLFVKERLQYIYHTVQQDSGGQLSYNKIRP